MAALSKADQAVEHMLGLIKRDGRYSYLLGYGSQAYALLNRGFGRAPGDQPRAVQRGLLEVDLPTGAGDRRRDDVMQPLAPFVQRVLQSAPAAELARLPAPATPGKKVYLVEDGPHTYADAVKYIYDGAGTSPRRVWSIDLATGQAVDVSEDVARDIAQQAETDNNLDRNWAREFVELHGGVWPEEPDAFGDAADRHHERRRA